MIAALATLPATAAHRPSAVFTVVSSDAYAMGAVALARSIHAVGDLPTGTALVCIAPTEAELRAAGDGHGLSERAIGAIQRAGWSLQRHAAAELQTDQPLWGGRNFTVGAPLKLHAWALTEYERVLFIDADSLVLRSLAPLLSEDRYWRGNITSSFEVCGSDLITALFGATPSAETFAWLSARLFDEYVHDQQFLNDAFRAEWRHKSLSERFPQLSRVGLSHCAVGQPRMSMADGCVQEQLRMAEHHAFVFDFQGFAKPWSWPEHHVGGCQRMEQWAMLWAVTLVAADVGDVARAMRGFQPEADNRPLLAPILERGRVAVDALPASERDASFAPAALLLLPAQLVIGTRGYADPSVYDASLGQQQPPPQQQPQQQQRPPQGSLPQAAPPQPSRQDAVLARLFPLASESHARWLEAHASLPPSAAARLEAAGARLAAAGGAAAILDEARALVAAWPTLVGTLSLAAAAEMGAGNPARAVPLFEDLLVLMPPGAPRERIRYDLSHALLRMDRPALASAQAHLAIVVAAAVPDLSLMAAKLLDELPGVLEKTQRASLGATAEPPRAGAAQQQGQAGSGMLSRVAVDETGASGDATPTPVLFPPPRGYNM